MPNKKLFYGIFAAIGMMVLILDSRTALLGARDGIELCLNAVIPALFPFFILSPMLTNTFLGKQIPILKPITKLCGIPNGAESLFLIGMLCGHPVGAGLINDACKKGNISRDEAERMLGFCCNAGPSFIFGILGPQLGGTIQIWSLWAVHIICSLIIGYILPNKECGNCQITENAPMPLPKIMWYAIRNMAVVCGWVILFRVFLVFCNFWFLWLFPETARILFTGIAELSNGCLELYRIPKEGARFILSTIMTGFGGLCVTMQTVAVTADIGMGMYLHGKVLQTLLSVAIAIPLQRILYPSAERLLLHPMIYVLIVTVILVYVFCLRKKTVAFPSKMLYTVRKSLHNRG